MLLRPSGGAAPQGIHGVAPRVLQLLPDAPSLSSTNNALALASALQSDGGVSVVAGGNALTEAKLSRASVDHRPFSSARPSMFQHGATHALLDTVHHRQIDLIHVHGAEAGLAARAFADAANLPLVMTCDEVPASSGFLSRRAARKTLSGRPVVVRSTYAAQCLRRDFGLAETDVQIIRPGIDAAAFDAGMVTQARTIALAGAWGLQDDARPVILVPGATADPQWLDWVLNAAAAPEAPEAAWILCGQAQETAAALAQINRSAALGRVRWFADCSDWAAAYKLAALVMSLPVSRNGWCPHALQAQAMGRSVVASDVGGNGEGIEPGKTGWLVRHRDIGSLIYAASAAMDREDIIREAMSLAGRTLVRSRYSLSRMQSETLSLYQDVLAQAAPG
ncbi:MAG: glycosyltransferase [Pseudomonadota bacterium]